VIDGAHNEEGIAALAVAISEEFPSLGWTIVMGVLGDKDMDSMLEHLARYVTRFHATAPQSERARPAGEVAAAARRIFGPQVEVFEESDVPSAIAAARAATSPDGALLVTGSLYVVGEARLLLAGPSEASSGSGAFHQPF